MPSSVTAALAAPAIIQNGQGSLVIVEGHEGSGSGFICEMGGQKFLFTNAHVLAGNSQINFTLLNGQPVRVGGGASAVGHDMVRLEVAPALAALSAAEKVNETLLVGDDVLVLGNEKGARVITPLGGKVVGLGPNLVEVDAPFQPGNSGSPIIQVKTGKVVGIATYVRKERDELSEPDRPPQRSGDARTGQPAEEYHAPVKLRRFGYRLDSVKAWQPVNWAEFQAEAAMIKKVDGLTKDILGLMQDVDENKGHISTNVHYGTAVQRPLQDFFDALSHHPSPADVLQAKQRLLDSLRRACQTDIAEVRPRLRYDYFQRDAAETQRYRDQLSKEFDEALHSQTERPNH